jgi:phage baseplate assembly protein W
MAVYRALSSEDRNLSSSIVGSRARQYSDIDLVFSPNTIGDVYKKKDAAAVRQSVKNIILTNFQDKPFQPTFGTNIRDLLFELSFPEIEILIEQRIELAIKTWEPRALLVNVDATVMEELNDVKVRVEFQVINIQETVVIETFLSRLK